jgi:hypothetical protein
MRLFQEKWKQTSALSTLKIRDSQTVTSDNRGRFAMTSPETKPWQGMKLEWQNPASSEATRKRQHRHREPHAV